MILYALRHARTEPAPGPLGRRDVAIVGSHAQAADAALAALPATRPLRVWSSPLSRCAGTARLLAARLDVPHVVDERLLEIDHGDWEGRPWDELERTAPAAYAAWMNDWQRIGPPGGESALALEARVGAWLTTLTDATHLLVAHAGVVRALRVLCAGASWPDAMAMPVPCIGEPEAVARFGA